MKRIRLVGKRMLSVILIISMLLPMLPSVESKAEEAENATVENSTGDTKKALIDNANLGTTYSSVQGKDNGRNPLTGENDVSVSVNPSPELMIGEVGSYDSENQEQNVVQTVYELEGQKTFSDKNGRVVKDEKYGDWRVYDDEAIAAVRTVAFDPIGDGVDRYVAEVTAQHAVTGTNNEICGTLICLKVYDATKEYQSSDRYSDTITLGYLRFDMEEWQADAYMQVAPGDFDGDGVDELAVYCPTDPEGKGDDLSRETTCSYVTIYEVERYDDGTFGLMEGVQMPEGFSSRYYIDPARNSKHNDGNVAYMNAANDICAVDLETIRHPGYTKDSLAIATSPARNGSKVKKTQDAETQVDIWLDVTKQPQGDNLSQHDMRWDLHTYELKNKEGKEYDIMMLGGISAGDMDNDGKDELVVAGYRIRNTGKSDNWQLDNRYVFVERLVPTENGYANSGTVPQILNMGNNGSSAFYSGYAAEARPTDREKVMLSPLSIKCYKGRGRDFADVLYVNGVVYEWKQDHEAAYVRKNQDGKSQGGYARIASVMNSVNNKIANNVEHSTVYKNTLLTGHLWFSNLTAGNFDNNLYGMEQLYGLINYVAGDKAGVSLVGIAQKEVGEYDSDSKIYVSCKKTADRGKCITMPLCAPDVDDDAQVVGYTSQKIYYSNPQPIAILQAPPYHKALESVDDGYPNTGSTGFTIANAQGEATTHSFTATAGAIMGVEQSFSLFGLFKTGISTMTELSGGAGYEGTKTTTTVYEREYNLTTSDYVVAMVVPYVRYRYNVKSPSFTTWTQKELNTLSAKIRRLKTTLATKEGKKKIQAAIIVLQESYENQKLLAQQYGYGKTVKNETVEMTYAQPGKPAVSAMKKSKYNQLVTDLNQPELLVSDDVLHGSTPGDVASYIWDGNTTVSNGKWSEEYTLVDRGDPETVVSQSISEETETEKVVTWNAGLHQETTLTAGGLSVGYSVNLEYAGAKADIKASTTTAHGNVAYIPDAIDDDKEENNESLIGNQYNFNYKLGTWMTKIGNNDCRVIGYQVQRVVDNQKFPPKPVKEVELIPLYSDKGEFDGIKVRWSLEDVATQYYSEPQQFKVVLNGDDTYLETVNASNAYNEEEKCYEFIYRAGVVDESTVWQASVRPVEIPVASAVESSTLYAMSEANYQALFAKQPNPIYYKPAETGTRTASIETTLNKFENMSLNYTQFVWQYSEPDKEGVWRDFVAADDELLAQYGIQNVQRTDEPKSGTYKLEFQYDQVPSGMKFRLLVPYSIKNNGLVAHHETTSNEVYFACKYDDLTIADITASDNGLILKASTKDSSITDQIAGATLKNLSDSAASKNLILNTNIDTKVQTAPGVYQLDLTNTDKSVISSDKVVYYGNRDTLLATTATKDPKKKAVRMLAARANAATTATDVDNMTYGESLQFNTEIYRKDAADPNTAQTIDNVEYRVVSHTTGLDVTDNCMIGNVFTPDSAGLFTIYASVNDGTTDVMAVKNVEVKASGERYAKENLEAILKTNLEPIEGVAYGCAKSADAIGLPKTTQIMSDNGTVYDVEIAWDLDSCNYDPANTSAQTFEVTGEVKLPNQVVNDKSVPTKVSVSVTVDAEQVAVTEPEKNESNTSAPTGTITVGQNTYTDYKKDVVFDTAFDAPQNVTITGTDEEEELTSIAYIKSKEALSLKQLQSVTEWTEGTELTIAAGEQCVIYAKLENAVGNTTYLSTSGIIIKGADSGEPTDPVDPGTAVEPTDPGTVSTPVDAGDASSAIKPQKGSTYAVGEVNYKVTGNGEVQLAGVSNKKIKSMKVPATVQIFGETFKVTSIKAGAFKNMKKLKKVVIGKYVTTIEKEAFYGCTKLKNIVIKTSLLKNKSIGKNAFAKISKKPKFVVPAKKLKSYKKLLKVSNITSKAKITK